VLLEYGVLVVFRGGAADAPAAGVSAAIDAVLAAWGLLGVSEPHVEGHPSADGGPEVVGVDDLDVWKVPERFDCGVDCLIVLTPDSDLERARARRIV